MWQPRPATAENERPVVDAAAVQALAEGIETEMWRMFELQTSSAYKAKFRTLLFNLKDERNQVQPSPPAATLALLLPLVERRMRCHC
jgi:hypothetical protein